MRAGRSLPAAVRHVQAAHTPPERRAANPALGARRSAPARRRPTPAVAVAAVAAVGVAGCPSETEALDEPRDFIGRVGTLREGLEAGSEGGRGGRVRGSLGGCVDCRGRPRVDCRDRLRDKNSGLLSRLRHVHQHERLPGVCACCRCRVGDEEIDRRLVEHEFVVRARQARVALALVRPDRHANSDQPRLGRLLLPDVLVGLEGNSGNEKAFSN